MVDTTKNITVPVRSIFLLLSNPRHEPYQTEDAAIEYLCAHEYVYPLARDIVKYGMNPLERFAVIPAGTSKRGSKSSTTYYAAEGNRRLCALKLLNDPDRAPASLRKAFEKLAEGWTPIPTVDAVSFPNMDAVKIWLNRIHNGTQGGIGRKDWSPEQKQRFSGSSKNKAAQVLLDYAEQTKMITPQERKGKLTTVQRFVGNSIFAETLGLDQSNQEDIARTRPKPEFDLVVKRFMRDVIDGKATSRMNRTEIVKYARPLGSMPGVSAARIEPESLSVMPASGKGKRQRRTPSKPSKAKHVTYEQEIHNALKSLGNGKLQSLYYSITYIELEHHTPIVCVGAWAFFDTLTACAGRSANMSFEAFLSKDRLSNFGLADSRSERAAIGRMLEYGNSTKHHAVSASFNGDQLNNDMVTLKHVILKCIENASKKAQP